MVAEESGKIRKMREKLRKRLETMEMQVTREALAQKTQEIQRWISRHASERVPLKKKNIALFDENQNAAELSQRIRKLSIQLQKTPFLQ